MNPARTPNYILKSSFSWTVSGRDSRELPQGASVRPIHISYVPAHVIERHEIFNPAYDVFVYCRYGIILVPKHLVVEV